MRLRLSNQKPETQQQETRKPYFKGISAPFEAPENPDLKIVITDLTVEESVEKILELLEKEINMSND